VSHLVCSLLWDWAEAHRTPCRPVTYNSNFASSGAEVDDVDHYLLREFATGQQPETLTHVLHQHYGRRMTVDDMILKYRSAYWKMKAWQERDTITMEQAVRYELDRFWERIAQAVSISASSRDTSLTLS